MNSRRWIIIAVLFFILLFVTYQVLWRVFSVDERLKNLILSEIRANTEGEVAIGRVSLSLHALNFHDVSLRFNRGTQEIKIQNLALGFSLFNFLKYNLNPIRVISDIVVDKPTIKFTTPPSEAGKENLSGPHLNVDSLGSQYEHQVIDLGFVGRISINDGSLIWVNADSVEVGLLSNLRGWISTTDLEHSIVRMKGQLFGSKKNNIELSGLSNLKTGRIDSILINFSDNNLSTSIPTIFPNQLKFESGELHGGVVIHQSTQGGLVVTGFVNLENATLNLLNGKIILNNLTSKAFVKNWDIEITSCHLEYGNSPVDLSGRIKNILNPDFDLSLQYQGVELAKLTGLLDAKNKLLITGKMDGQFRITESVQNPFIKGRITIPGTTINHQVIRNLTADVVYSNQNLQVNRLAGRVRDFSFVNSGTIRFSSLSPQLDFHFLAKGDGKKMAGGLLNPDVESLPVTVRGTVHGVPEALQGQADLMTVATFPGQDSLSIVGTLALDQQILLIHLNHGDSPFDLKAKLKIGKKNLQMEGTLHHFGEALWEIFALPFQDQLKKKMNISLSFAGDTRYVSYSFIAHRNEYTGDSDKLFQIDGFLNVNGKTRVQGNIIYFPETGGKIPGKIKLAWNSRKLTVDEYRLGGFYSASGTVALTGDRELSGRFNIDQVDLPYIFDGIFLHPNFDVVGKLSGGLTFRGSLNDPEVEGHLELSDGIIRAAGYYTGSAEFELNHNLFQLKDVQLYLEKKKLLDVVGEIDLKQNLLNLNIRGKKVDAPMVLGLLIASDVDFLTGKADIDLNLTDSVKNPDLRGQITATNGTLFFVQYDTLQVKVGRTGVRAEVAASSSEAGPGFYMQKARLVKGKRYILEGNGYLPFSTKEDLNVRIHGHGDAFALLFADQPFVQGSRSDAEFTWGFGGTYGSPIYTEGKVVLRNGRLQLEDLAPLVENIQGDVVLEPINQFLRFDNVTGTIRDYPFYLATRMDSTVTSRGLEPLLIENWGLNFGVIEISTGKKGVPLHIPGLIEKGEEGWFILSGKPPEEKFIIAGPAEHPLARGKIFAHDTPITFPFIEEEVETTEPGLTEKILESMLWDVDLVPLKDIRYVKKLPGLIDNVWINAYIDSKVSGLRLSGIIADESFRAEGMIQSTRGSIEYLDLNFAVEKFAAEFDRSDIYPIVYGRAKTTISDSTGFPSNVFLTLYVYDKETKQELEKGRWSDDLRFKLSSDNPTLGSSEGQILAALGYSPETLNSVELLGASTDHLLFRPLFRPVERKLERTFGLDVIRFRSHFARNMMDVLRPHTGSGMGIFYYNSDPTYDIDPRYLLFRSTQLMVGKYLSDNLYFLYSGQIDAGRNLQYQERGVGLRHSLDLEYRIFPNLLLELQYNYDSLLQNRKEDKRIQIRHSFHF